MKFIIKICGCFLAITVIISSAIAFGNYASNTGSSINFSCSAPRLQRISVTKEPIKTTYAHGEAFDPSGMIVTGYYPNGVTRTIENYQYTPGQNGSAWKLISAGSEMYTYGATALQSDRFYSKANDGDALFTTAIYQSDVSDTIWYSGFLIGKTESSVEIDISGNYTFHETSFGSVEFNGETWYYSFAGNTAIEYYGPAPNEPPFLNSFTKKDYYSSSDAVNGVIALDLLELYHSSIVGEGQSEIELTYTENNITKTTTQPIIVNAT